MSMDVDDRSWQKEKGKREKPCIMEGGGAGVLRIIYEGRLVRSCDLAAYTAMHRLKNFG